MLNFLLVYINKIFKFFFLSLIFVGWFISNFILTLLRFVKWGFYVFFFWFLFIFRDNALLKVIFFDLLFSVNKTIFLNINSYFLRSFGVYYNFSVFIYFKWPLIKPLLGNLIDFVFKKIKVWCSFLFDKGVLLSWDTSYNISFLLYIYAFLLFYLFFFLTVVSFFTLYLNIIFLAILVLLVYLTCFFVYYFFINLLKYFLSDHLSNFFIDFVYILNFFTGYLNIFWLSFLRTNLNRQGKVGPDFTNRRVSKSRFGFINTFRKSETSNVLISYISLFLMSVNLNSAKFITFFKRHGLLKTNLQHLPSYEEVFFRNLEYNANQLQEYHSIQDKFLTMSLEKPSNNFTVFKSIMIQRLLQNFLRPTQFDMLLDTRNLLAKTKYPGSVPEFKYFWSLYKDTGMMSRSFDLIASTTWAQKVEHQLLRSRFYVEARYAYKSRHGRAPLLIYNFFRHGALPVQFWSTFYTKMKRARTLGRKIDRAVQLTKAFPEMREQLVNIHYPVRVRKQEIPIKLSTKLERQQFFLNKRGMYTDEAVYNGKQAFKPRFPFFRKKKMQLKSHFSTIFRLISVDAPIIFSFLANLNYLILILFGELFGDFFRKQVHYASNLYNIRFQIEQNILFNFRVRWLSKLFSFLFFDFWFYLIRSVITFYFFTRFRLFHANFLWYLLSKSFQILVFFLQALKINERSALSLFYVYFYKDFFKFKFNGKQSHKLFKKWGYIAVLIESFIFFFSFFIILFFDFVSIWVRLLLRNKFFVYIYLSIKNFVFYFIRVFLTFFFNPLYYICLYCEEFDLETRRFKTQEHLNIYGKGPQVFEPVELFLVGFIFWRTLVKKYWWTVEIEGEEGIKRWPFFFKLSKKFPWFDRFFDFLYNSNFLLIYFYRLYLKGWFINLKVYCKMLLQMKPYPFFQLLMFMIRMGLGLTLYIYMYISYLHRNYQRRSFRRAEYSTDKPEIISFNSSYNRLKSLASYFFKSRCNITFASEHEGSFVPQDPKSTLKQSDLRFVVKTKTFYSAIKGYEGIFSKQTTARFVSTDSFVSNELHKFKSQTAVNSLYSLYGYKRDFNGSVNPNIEEEMQTDLFRSKKVLWSTSIHKVSNYICGNINLVSIHGKYKKGNSSKLCGFYNNFFIDDGLFRVLNHSRRKNLKDVSGKLCQTKKRSRFLLLDRHFFNFFCNFLKSKLKLMHWKNNIKFHLTETQHNKFPNAFAFGTQQEQYSFLSNILLKSHEIKLSNLKEFFKKRREIDSFLSVLKNNPLKIELFGKSFYDNCEDFVTFYHNFSRFSYTNIFPVDLKFKLSLSWISKSKGSSNPTGFGVSREYKGDIRDAWISYMKWFLPVKLITYEWRIMSLFFANYAWHLLITCWKISSNKAKEKRKRKSRVERIVPFIYATIGATVVWILEKVFHIYKDPAIPDKKYNIEIITVFDENINMQAKSKIKKNEETHPFFEGEQRIPTTASYLAAYVLQFEPEMKFLTNPIVRKKAKIFFENFIWFYCEFLLAFVNLLQTHNKPNRFSFFLSGVFFFIWQATIIRSIWMKAIYSFWSCFSQEVFFFYSTFLYTHVFRHRLNVNEIWLGFISDVFSLSLCRYFEESLKEGSFLRRMPAEEYKWRGDVAQSLELHKKVVDEFMDLILRREVSAVKFKKKGELISDHELFWRNFLHREKGFSTEDHILTQVFQVRGNIIARSRAYAIHRFLHIAANLRFYYHKVFLGYDRNQRANVFLQEYPEFRDFFGDQKDIHYWRRNYDTRGQRKQAKAQRGFYMQKSFLNILPDLWFFGKRILKLKLWREHFFLKFWVWFSSTSNIRTNVYFLVFGIIVLGFGFLNMLSLNGLTALLSILVSYIVFVFGILYWLIESTAYQLLGFSWPMLREISELFFYNFVLYPDLQSVLISLGLYDVFLFFMNNFVLYEADIFVKQRIVLIFVTTAWIFIHTVLFNLITLPLLFLNVFLHDLYLIDFFVLINQTFLQWLGFELALQTNFLDFKYNVLMFVHFYLLFMYNIVFKILPSVFWQFLFFLEYGWGYFWLQLLNLSISHFWFKQIVVQAIVWLSWKFAILCFPEEFVTNSMLLYDDAEFFALDILWRIIIRVSRFFHIADETFAVYCWWTGEFNLNTAPKYDVVRRYILPLQRSDFLLSTYWDIDTFVFWRLLSIYKVYCILKNIVILLAHIPLILSVEILIKVLDVFIFVDFTITFILNFFFTDLIFSDLVVFILHSFIWVYLNLIYYLVLVPFMKLLFGLFFAVKFLFLLPIKLWMFSKTFVFLSYFIFEYLFSILKGFIHFISLVALVFKPFVNLVLDYNMLDIPINLSNFIIGLLIFPFKLLWEIFLTFFEVCSSILLLNHLFNMIWDLVDEFWYLFYLLIKEVLSLFLLIWKLMFRFLAESFSSFGLFFWFLVEVIDALFPSLKYIFNPIGGVSVFYATFYYYLFVFICYIWSLSFRAFNDTTREPPLPTEVWPEVVAELEDHPIIKRLPFDVYQLLYSEKLCTRKGLPDKLDQSLRSWLPSKTQPNLARLTQVKTTPLNAQGYYYMLLNGLTKKAVKVYYKTRKSIFVAAWEKSYRTLGVKEFFHFLRDLPLDILDATSEFLRFEWKTDKPIFERDAKKTLGEKLNLPIILESFELIFPKDIQHIRKRDEQIFEQLLTERFGSGQADEIIWSFPVLGKMFNVRSVEAQQEHFKLEIVKAGWKYGFNPEITPTQREIKKKLILHWLLKSRDIGFSLRSFEKKKWKENQSSLIYSLEANIPPSMHEHWDFENEMGGGSGLFSREARDKRVLEEYIEKNLESFYIKRYEKIAVITDRDGETLADPLFLAVRALDLFLYPVLVFATINTGWWYGSNGIMDAAMRYVKLEEYAAEMAEVFEHDMDMDALFSDKERLIRRIGSDAVSNMVLFDTKEAVDLFFPTQRTVDWFWKKFAKQHPELDANFSLLLEQDPYYFLETAASHITHPEDTRGLGREPWGSHIYGFWQDKYQDVIYKFKQPMDLELENLSSDLESILDSMQLIKDDVLKRDKLPYNLYKDYKLTKTDKQYDFKLKWREFLTSMEEEGLDVYEKRRLEFLSDIYNEDFLGYALYIASDFDLKRYDMSGAYFFADWHNKREVLDYDLTADDEVAKLKRLYDKVTADQAKQQLDRNVAALKKLAKDEGFETETEVGRRMLLQYALDYNLVRFEIEDEDQRRYAKILQEGGGDQFTDEELEQMQEKARERFHSIFLEVFTAFDAPDKEEEEMSLRLKTQREEKLKWFYDQLKRFKPAKHPLNEKEAIDDLLFVYHNFQRDPGYWFWTNPLLYKGFFSFFKDSFYSLDRRSVYVDVYNQNPTTWLMKPIKNMTDYYFIDEYVNPSVQFHPRLLHYANQKSISITRANPYPYGHDFLKTIEHRYNITRPYSKTQEFLDLLRESEISIYEAKGWDPRFTAKFHVDVDLFREEVLFGEIFYKFYTSGFASLFENDTLKWLLWGFYKLYEGTLLGDVIHKSFDSLFANSLMFGPSIMPVIITELDPETRMALFDRFGHGDLAPFRWDFYNAYTGFTFYNHNEEIYSKRNALFYFNHPEYFSDAWFLQNITSNPFIGITILSEHMKNASYERKSIFHLSEMNIQLSSFFKRYMSEEIKMVIRFGLYLWLYATEFTDILREYFSTYILLRAFYDLVITPLVLFYNASKSIYFILNEIGARIYQIYAYLVINLKILETLAHISIIFVFQPLKHFSLFVSEVFIWGINRILGSYKTEFLTDLGFDVWWKRTLIRHVFLYLGPSFEFISLSFLNNPTKILSLFNKRFLEYTSFFWNIEKMVALLKDPWAGRRSYDLQLPWVAGISWAGIGVGHNFGTHNLFRRMLLEQTYLWFLMDHWFKLNLTSVIFSIYNLSNWDYSSLQLLWQIISPHKFFSKVHIYAPWAFNEFIVVVCDKLDDHMPVYESIEWFLEKWTANAYNVAGLDMRALGKWQPNSFDDSYSQWIFVFSLADLEGLHKSHKDYFGFFGAADYRSSQTNKPFIKLRSTEGMPFMLRESVEAPYSIAISDGLIILNKAEQQFLSRRAINKVFSNEHFFAFDFLAAYNESFFKSDSAFKVTMRQAFSDLRFWNAYGFLQPMSDVSLRPAFTFDVSSNFYSNMRLYEQELGIQKLRYFFHRYQWLMQDVFPYKNDMTKLSDLFVEMVLERGIFDVMHMRFSNTKQAPELSDHMDIREETAILRVSVDIYGNLVYSLEGPEWFMNPEPTETDIFLNKLLYPALDNYAGFMINRMLPATKNSLFYIGGKISQFEKWLLPRRVGPSKEWIKIRVHFAEEAGHINPQYVYSLGGTIRYDVAEIMGEDWISPGMRERMRLEELEAKKNQEELDKMKQEIHAEWGLSEGERESEKTDQFTGWDSFEENMTAFSPSVSDSSDISKEEPKMLTLDQIIGSDLPTEASISTSTSSATEISANIQPTDVTNSMADEFEAKEKEPKTRMRITRIEPDPEYTIRIYFENVPETEMDEPNVEDERGDIEEEEK